MKNSFLPQILHMCNLRNFDKFTTYMRWQCPRCRLPWGPNVRARNSTPYRSCMFSRWFHKRYRSLTCSRVRRRRFPWLYKVRKHENRTQHDLPLRASPRMADTRRSILQSLLSSSNVPSFSDRKKMKTDTSNDSLGLPYNLLRRLSKTLADVIYISQAQRKCGRNKERPSTRTRMHSMLWTKSHRGSVGISNDNGNLLYRVIRKGLLRTGLQ